MINKKIEFIYWFSFYNNESSSVRYRATYPLDNFEKLKGVKYYHIIPSYSIKEILKFSRAYFSALFFRKRNSLIVIQRVQSNFIYSRLLKILIYFRNQNSIYDIDDADYLITNPNTIYYFAKRCDKVSAGSKQIESHLKQFNSNIIHITSPIVDLGIVKQNKSNIFTIGWIGDFSGGHKEAILEIIFPVLKQIGFQFKLILIGVSKRNDREFMNNYFSEHSNIQLEIADAVDWNDERAIQEKLVTFDIGLATLTNEPIQIAKSGIKAKQYMNNGIPVISTNLPENNSYVIDGFNGILCTTPNDFANAINKFYLMDSLEYNTYSKNARNSIAHFNHNKYYNDFGKLVCR